MEKLSRKIDGFSLVEVLVVMAIIGLLAIIAIPQFAAYRKKGFEAQVKEDLRNAAAAQESYFATNQAYVGGALTNGTPPEYNRTAPVVMTAQTVGNTFTLTATHANCVGVSWSYSSVGGAIDGGPCP